MMREEQFAELLSRTLTAFQWAVHVRYGADKDDFQELYRMMALKLKRRDGMRQMADTLRGLGLEVECGEI